MSATIHPDQAVRIQHAERRWLDQCADRLRVAAERRRSHHQPTPEDR
jgi:hypothetical protein